MSKERRKNQHLIRAASAELELFFSATREFHAASHARPEDDLLQTHRLPGIRRQLAKLVNSLANLLLRAIVQLVQESYNFENFGEPLPVTIVPCLQLYHAITGSRYSQSSNP